MMELNGYPYCGHSAVMGKRSRLWQDVDYVLGYFGKTVRTARRSYVDYVEAGIEQGRREDLVGGGLIRSLGGWSEVKKLRLSGQNHIKSDERILGDSDFVDSILSQADEKYTRQCDLRRRGYDVERIAQRVAQIYKMDPQDVVSKGRQRQKVMARSVLCFWAVRELGMPVTTLAKRLEMSAPGVGYAVQRGEAIVRDHHYSLTS